MTEKRLIVGITGASGAVYGVRLLEILRETEIETHLILSNSASLTLKYELGMKLETVKALADATYAIGDVAASVSSGSFRTAGMIIAPCSIRTMSNIAYGDTSNLISRTADVVLKERRRLVLMLRESPLHLGHLRAATAVTEMGAIVAPPVPAFYNNPASIDDIVVHSVGRALDLFDIDVGLVKRWAKPE
jgi:4-hydroxy-3-polyprenylbenzoate decarboxylase